LEGRITIFSTNQPLVALVKEALGQSLGPEFTLEARADAQIPLPAGLCIWDFVPGETVFPLGVDWTDRRKHLFLANRKHLNALSNWLGVCGLTVLPKPVTPVVLKSLFSGYDLGQANPRDTGGRARTLRSERDEMFQVLIQTNLKLQEFNHAKNNFLMRSIHEFRVPLTAISGYCELLLEGAVDSISPAQREILERMQHSVKRLTQATNSMLQLGMAENSAPNLNLERADIRDCVGQALQDLSVAFENKRISVSIDLEPAPAGLLFEKAQITQALANLLENACKFTPRDGIIEVKGYPFFWDRRTRPASLDGSRDRRLTSLDAVNSFRVDIRDSGPGILPVHANELFEEHRSYCGGQDRSGAGLGLAICRLILSQHGGRIWAESSPGGGMFSFVLPLRPTDNQSSRWNNDPAEAQLPQLVEN
jgi:signal transduction histidine kinase